MIKIRITFSLLALILNMNLFAQSFQKSEDKLAGEKYIEYNHVNAGIIIRKIIFKDTTSKPIYELGLIVYRKTFAPTDFMEKRTYIVFEDQSFLSFADSIVLTYFQVGKHGYCFKRRLTESELSFFQTKRIDYFSI